MFQVITITMRMNTGDEDGLNMVVVVVLRDKTTK